MQDNDQIMPVLDDLATESKVDSLITMVQRQESLLSLCQIDNFNISRRRLNSRKSHLGTTYLTQANKPDLKGYYIHLVSKQIGDM